MSTTERGKPELGERVLLVSHDANGQPTDYIAGIVCHVFPNSPTDTINACGFTAGGSTSPFTSINRDDPAAHKANLVTWQYLQVQG